MDDLQGLYRNPVAREPYLFRGSFGFDIAFNSSASLETFCQYNLKLSSLRKLMRAFTVMLVIVCPVLQIFSALKAS